MADFGAVVLTISHPPGGVVVVRDVGLAVYIYVIPLMHLVRYFPRGLRANFRYIYRYSVETTIYTYTVYYIYQP